MKRREFLTAVGLATVTASVLGKAKMAWAQAKAELIDMSKKKRKDKLNETAVGIATGLVYVEDAKKAKRVDKPGKTAGTTVKAADQHCDNCNWYKSKDPTAMAGKGAPCQMIPTAPPGVLVHAKGYCNSWMANQQA